MIFWESKTIPMASAGASVIPGGVRHVTTCVTHSGRNHAAVAAEQILHTPETTAGKSSAFGVRSISSLPLLSSETAYGSRDSPSREAFTAERVGLGRQTVI